MVAAHEQIDLRIWDQFYGRWRPIEPYLSLHVLSRSDWGVDIMELSLPRPHVLDAVLHYTRVAPAPITLHINGIDWTGRVQEARPVERDGVSTWEIQVVSDKKHVHRMQARSPRTESSVPADIINATLGAATRELITQAVARTGLPVYLQVDIEGPKVELEARTEDSVATVLAKVTERAPVFVDVRMIIPGMPLPTGGEIVQIMGPTERAWVQKMLSDGWWPHATTDTRVIAAPPVVENPMPPGWFPALSSIDHLGRERPEVQGISWTPFETKPIARGDAGAVFYRDGSERKVSSTRAATHSELEQLASTVDRRWFGRFVTQWAAGQWSIGRDLGLLPEAVKAGLVRRADGVRVTETTIPALHAYIGNGAAWAWKEGPVWVVANRTDWQAQSAKHTVYGPQKITPGLLIRLHGERDRRHVVFSTAPGGGLEGWEARITGPDGAALIAGTQWDQWMTHLMSNPQSPLSARARDGVRAQVSADRVAGSDSPIRGVADAVTASGGTIAGIAADITPRATIPGSEVAFNQLTANVDMAKAGAMFYRERFISIGSGSWTADTAAQFEAEWSAMQGGTALTLTPGTTGSCVFGNDVVRPDGTTMFGWMPGDRISFFDGSTHISEVVSGWELSVSDEQPLRVQPLLGKREDHATPVDALVDTVRELQRAQERGILAPPTRLPKAQLDGAITDVSTDVSTRVATEVATAAAQGTIDAKVAQWSRESAALLQQSKDQTAESNRMLGESAKILGQVRGISADVNSLMERTRGYSTAADMARATVLEASQRLNDAVRDARIARDSAQASLRSSENAVRDASKEVEKAAAHVKSAKQWSNLTDAAKTDVLRSLASAQAAEQRVNEKQQDVLRKHAEVLRKHDQVNSAQQQVNAKHSEMIRINSEAVKVHDQAIRKLNQADERLSSTVSSVQQAQRAANDAADSQRRATSLAQQSADSASRAAAAAQQAATDNAEALRQLKIQRVRTIQANTLGPLGGPWGRFKSAAQGNRDGWSWHPQMMDDNTPALRGKVTFFVAFSNGALDQYTRILGPSSYEFRAGAPGLRVKNVVAQFNPTYISSYWSPDVD